MKYIERKKKTLYHLKNMFKQCLMNKFKITVKVLMT